jgi:hypothetical protein
MTPQSLKGLESRLLRFLQVRKRLLALFLRIVGRCPWCLTEFTDTS